MPGPPTFVIGEFAIRPEAPASWSFSALRGFEECPMRWALSRTANPCFGGLVPQKPNRGGVEGTLLHELIERYERYTRNPGAESFRPRRTLLELVAAWAKSNEANPRIDSKALAGQVRLEEILRAFGEASSHVKGAERQSNTGTRSGGNRSAVLNGSESWLRDPKSKLCGRADFISMGEIVDFKSGEQNDYHADQIVFYGALYLAAAGEAPTVLRLIYTGTNEAREVPVPTLNELESVLEEMRRRAAVADQQVTDGELPARPEQTKCAYCHVRGFCEKYWESLSSGSHGDGPVVDYAPTTAAVMDSAALGIYVRDNVAGVASLLHLPQEIAEKVGGGVGRIRCLALRATTGPTGVRFTLTHGSEVYVC
jgi:CRISPR/Cas system-associated exonuclease Cas4 (RecB family)